MKLIRDGFKVEWTPMLQALVDRDEPMNIDYKEEYNKLYDLLERFYIASSTIDYTLPIDEVNVSQSKYDEFIATFIEVEEFLGID